MSLSHFDDQGQAHMVDVSDKDVTDRIAVAEGCIKMRPDTLDYVLKGSAKKGDVLGIARIAGIMAAKKNRRSDPAMPSAADHQGHAGIDARYRPARRADRGQRQDHGANGR